MFHIYLRIGIHTSTDNLTLISIILWIEDIWIFGYRWMVCYEFPNQSKLILNLSICFLDIVATLSLSALRFGSTPQKIKVTCYKAMKLHILLTNCFGCLGIGTRDRDEEDIQRKKATHNRKVRCHRVVFSVTGIQPFCAKFRTTCSLVAGSRWGGAALSASSE